jgi:hypothetical protein
MRVYTPYIRIADNHYGDETINFYHRYLQSKDAQKELNAKLKEVDITKVNIIAFGIKKERILMEYKEIEKCQKEKKLNKSQKKK